MLETQWLQVTSWNPAMGLALPSCRKMGTLWCDAVSGLFIHLGRLHMSSRMLEDV